MYVLTNLTNTKSWPQTKFAVLGDLLEISFNFHYEAISPILEV